MIVFIGLIIHPGQVGLIYVLVILMALGLASVYQVPWSMIPDCVDVHQLVTQKRTDGIIFGFIAFLQKVAGAVAIAAVGSTLTAIGYVAAAEQTAETLQSMKYVYGFGCGGIFLITVLIILLYPLSKKRHDDVLEAIDAREQGEAVDMSQFKDLF